MRSLSRFPGVTPKCAITKFFGSNTNVLSEILTASRFRLHKHFRNI